MELELFTGVIIQTIFLKRKKAKTFKLFIDMMIPSINFHLWEPCNFRCKFCFATFQDVRSSVLPKGHLPKADALKLIEKFAEAGFSKITFAGGEPTLCPWIADLISHAKMKGLTTMIVTNGSGINEDFLSRVADVLDWVVISIDSVKASINLQSGRHQGSWLVPNHQYYQEKVALVRKWKLKLKINTVINRTNYLDDSLTPFILALSPMRWKIFQALRINGQNDLHFDEVAIDETQFQLFIKINRIKDIPFAVEEDNNAMTGTYIMVDPAGRFFDDTKGFHTYSKPILDVGVHKALESISYNYEGFIDRKGIYDW